MTTELLLLDCPHCAAKNRLPAARVTEDPACGRCGQPLVAGTPIALTDASFDAVVAASALPVLVDFWAPWCGPCRAMAPAYAEAATRLAGRALLVKVDSDANPQLAARFAIRSIPTLVRLDAGVERKRHSGALPLGQIVALAS